jgi:hypothetical protein
MSRLVVVALVAYSLALGCRSGGSPKTSSTTSQMRGTGGAGYGGGAYGGKAYGGAMYGGSKYGGRR